MSKIEFHWTLGLSCNVYYRYTLHVQVAKDSRVGKIKETFSISLILGQIT